ncbi:MAG: 16S rRNA (guanine(966)-N(2))-methyltransferase RsmD [Ruminococcaceae bacterium]|nr:16S rRNA (guanine(966)-N(2))-methyltransferase RsmD [Oscillospiraceae bacterium]
MRVITGTAKGRNLATVSGTEVVRPTSQKVKEAIFSAIQFDLEGRRVLDLFAGSGQLGIEALSRGAASAVFVDTSRESIEVTKANLTATNLLGQAVVLRSDYKSFLNSTSDTFDIAFLDPPYSKGLLTDALALTASVMSDYGIIVCEHPPEVVLPNKQGGFAVSRSYKYGKIALTVYRKEVEAVE